jgi:hypothetical protein
MNRFALILVLLFLTTVTTVEAKNDNTPGGGQGNQGQSIQSNNSQGKKEESNSNGSLKQGPQQVNLVESSLVSTPSASPKGKKPTATGSAVAASKEECKKSGWSIFNIFKNQGDCISNVATKGKNAPSGGVNPNPSASSSASPVASGSADPSPSASASASPIATDSAGLVQNFNSGMEEVIEGLNGIIGKLKKLLKLQD